ncbi:MAG: exopolysaccharide biosynthesis protein, partial [Thermocrispum sp.]
MRLSVVGQIIRRRWRVLAAAAVIGAVLGFAASQLVSPGYQAGSQVLLQGSRDPDELLTESQIAVSSVVLERAASTLGWRMPVSELQEKVTAEIVDGNVIEIRATDADPLRARSLTDQVANEFVTYTSQLVSNPANSTAELVQEQQKALQQQVRDANQQLSELHRKVKAGSLTVEEVAARTTLEDLRTALTAAAKELDEAEAAATRANAVVIEPAELPTAQTPPTALHLTAGSALAGFLLGVAGHLVAARGDRRLRGADQIGSA